MRSYHVPNPSDLTVLIAVVGCRKLKCVSEVKKMGVQNQGVSRAALCLEPHRRIKWPHSSLIVTSNLWSEDGQLQLLSPLSYD